MLKDLVRLANHLDQKGLRDEVQILDSIIMKVAEQAEGRWTKTGPGKAVTKTSYNCHIRFLNWLRQLS